MSLLQLVVPVSIQARCEWLVVQCDVSRSPPAAKM